MLFTDTYLTITQAATGEFKDKGSKFLGFVYPIKTEDEGKEIVKQLKKEQLSQEKDLILNGGINLLAQKNPLLNLELIPLLLQMV